ncbi:metal ABC transporter solute-binding protein, Zn/Mn family [Psychroserpens sp.]|uniref:metal ABC transporter solute-binding protein, Zn/Mn family n=1 Tax=Psychroserpens sp. TaxID=2020870 RepID=UPI001B15FD8B|nr:zinc ABC transporter substrate-binding protein [Psychroserpens sp.]MBO6605486.1 zinc ABC transporter substrate-binding protein [Psychroserpens sp.]MBO6632579.1 zinc ABC transporter substrate-binding protein [Psychroserpens sp.]MBO6653705.1 zinc ABC transporter substrate-binding protein [Psychroserpens sp.]MBO6682026.1 zinc ABC transporter substrate-binding protein [Psychroserpens sp.]MBO6748860.1 zinc ABC transporter substrate-binding protein [Psychroserpens sp.]
MKRLKYISLLFILVVFNCKNETSNDNQKLNVVTTTTMITDLVKNIGGDHINVQGLMGSGVDPHLYKASEGDVSKLVNADVIFYNGLHLEGKLVEVFEKMKNKTPIALGEMLDKSTLIGSDYFASNYDPHVWFNIDYFRAFATNVSEVLAKQDPSNAEHFEANTTVYLKELDALEEEINTTIQSLPVEKRILVTAHDAFNYFGKAYEFEVVGLQGLSTATEAGVQDVQKLSAFIIEKDIKAIFVESSVPKRTIEALQAAVKSKGHDVTIGGTLYSDALGTTGTDEGTYIGMFKYNVNTIVNALK